MHQLTVQHHDFPAPSGNVHVRSLLKPDSKHLIVCLHPAPYDGSFFDAFLPLLADDFSVCAPDYPGYGESVVLTEKPTIGSYANNLLGALSHWPEVQDCSYSLLGFHTGCLVAAEMSLLDPARVNKLVLVDVPYFNASDRAKKYTSSVTENANSWGFHAAFTYRCEDRFPRLTHTGIVVATNSSLSSASINAAEAAPQLELKNCRDISRPAFTTGGETIAALVRALLDD